MQVAQSGGKHLQTMEFIASKFREMESKVRNIVKIVDTLALVM